MQCGMKSGIVETGTKYSRKEERKYTIYWAQEAHKGRHKFFFFLFVSATPRVFVCLFVF